MTWRRAALVLLLSCALKLAVFAALYPRGPDRILGQDTPTYEGPALALAQTGRFAVDAAHPDVPATLVPPGYPAFIAAIYRIFGERRAAVVIAQIAVSLVTLGLTFVIGARLWGEGAGLLALLALALDLVSFTYTQILFSETLFTALLVTACYAAVEQLLTGRVRWAAACGTALAATTLVRPITYYLFWPLLAGVVVVQWRRGVPVRKLAAVAVAMVLPWLLLVGGWRARNDRAVGRAQLSDIQAVNLLLYRAAGVVAVRDGISFYEAQHRLASELPDSSGLTKGEIDALYERQAIRILAAHPVLLLRTEAFGLVKVIAGTARAELLHYYGNEPYELEPTGAVGLSRSEATAKFAGRGWVLVPVAYVVAHAAVIYAGALYGLWIAWAHARGTRAAAVLLAAVAAYMMLIAAGPEAYARFRVPVMPVLALFAGLGYSTWVRSSPS